MAAKEIDRIIDVYGYVTDEVLVGEAENDDNPLHDCFEWNDAEAAKMHRLTQAKYILRQIETVIDRGDDKPLHIRAYHSVIEDDERFYTTLSNARNDPDMWEQVKEQALLEIKNWRKKYKDITEFEDLFGVIDGLK